MYSSPSHKCTAPSVVLSERGRTCEHSPNGKCVESGKQEPVTEDADIVERSVYGGEHVAYGEFSSVDRTPVFVLMYQRGRGSRGGNQPCRGLGMERVGKSGKRGWEEPEGAFSRVFGQGLGIVRMCDPGFPRDNDTRRV